MVIFFLLVILKFKGCSFSKSKLAPVLVETNIFFDKFKNKQIDSIYSDLSPEWKSKQSLDQFKLFLGEIENKIGLYQSGSVTNISILVK